jgi:hypothetical protein
MLVCRYVEVRDLGTLNFQASSQCIILSSLQASSQCIIGAHGGLDIFLNHRTGYLGVICEFQLLRTAISAALPIASVNLGA